MEDTLRDFSVTGYICKDAVLILVLMEDTLRVVKAANQVKVALAGLNPCFNGRYSQRNCFFCL